MTRIFRIQDDEGRGPYKRDFAEKWLDQDDSCLTRQPPGPDQFGLTIYTLVSGHGFRSLDQLRRWFTDSEMERLAGYGYQIVSMHVQQVVAESENQVLFWRSAPLTRGFIVLPWPHRVAA